MRLSQEEIERFERDGYLFYPAHFASTEIKVLTDEVPADGELSAGEGLVGGLLVAILRDVVDPERDQPANILGRPGLRHRDHGDLFR